MAFASVDEYIAAQPEAARAVLELVRRTIREAVPVAEEGISYQMPAYRLAGVTVLHFAGWKKHYSLYPVTAALVEGLEAVGELNERGTLRLRLDAPVPVQLIAGVAKRRAAQVTAKA